MTGGGSGAPGTKIWLVHPDLGIGGAEMLVVNMGLALLEHGYDVQIFTAHHDENRCFPETKGNGALGGRINVHGDWLPRTVLGRFHVVCAVLRMIWVSLVVSVLSWIGKGPDIIVCDQVSHVVPLLRAGTGKQVVFYCHFPDKLLCVDRSSLLKRIYRAPMDYWEEVSTGASDAVIVNSKFTASIFRESFKSLNHVDLRVLYPSVNVTQFNRKLTEEKLTVAKEALPEALKTHLSKFGTNDSITLLSINRFERKKNLLLAIEAFSKVLGSDDVNQDTKARLHLVVAGGYDPRLSENVEYMSELESFVEKGRLSAKVSFLKSFSDDQKLFLVQLARAVLYTPDKEHFGIVPIEAMSGECPVIAVASGGPLESIENERTGYLLEQNPEAFAKAMIQLVNDETLAKTMGKAGKERVTKLFSQKAFGHHLDEIVKGRLEDTSSGNNLVIVARVIFLSLLVGIFGVLFSMAN